MDQPPAGDFWTRAPDLFRLAEEIDAALEFSAEIDPVVQRVRALAEAVPTTGDALGDVDPYLVQALLGGAVEALLAIDAGRRQELRISVERVRQALRDLIDEAPVWRSGPKHAAIWLRQQGVPVTALEELFSASESTVRRWTNPEDDSGPTGENAQRVAVVAKMVNHLRHAMTPQGAVQWLLRPHPALDDRRPLDELKDVDSYRKLIHLSSGVRSFAAT